MNYATTRVDLKLFAVFLMGVSVGICIMLVYTTWRGPHHEVSIQNPAAEMDYGDE